MTMQKSLCALVACLGALAVASPQSASASVTFYDTQAAFQAATTTHLIENFSTAPIKNAPVPSLRLHGITYTGLAGTPFPNVGVAPPGYDDFGANVGAITQYVLVADGDENIVATFSTPYSAVGFEDFFNGLGPGVVTVFGPQQSVLGRFAFADGLDPVTHRADRGYLGFTSTTPIWGFEWDTTGGGELNTGFTDLSVSGPGAAGIPEAGSWAFMILGVGIVGGVLRRRRRAYSA